MVPREAGTLATDTAPVALLLAATAILINAWASTRASATVGGGTDDVPEGNPREAAKGGRVVPEGSVIGAALLTAGSAAGPSPGSPPPPSPYPPPAPPRRPSWPAIRAAPRAFSWSCWVCWPTREPGGGWPTRWKPPLSFWNSTMTPNGRRRFSGQPTGCVRPSKYGSSPKKCGTLVTGSPTPWVPSASRYTRPGVGRCRPGRPSRWPLPGSRPVDMTLIILK